MKKKLISTISIILLFLFRIPVIAHTDESLNLGEYVNGAGFIFKGEVTNVEYRDSELVETFDYHLTA